MEVAVAGRQSGAAAYPNQADSNPFINCCHKCLRLREFLWCDVLVIRDVHDESGFVGRPRRSRQREDRAHYPCHPSGSATHVVSLLATGDGKRHRKLARAYNPGAVADDRPVTALLRAWRQGEDAALEQLIPLVHAELHRIARRCMAGQRVGHSLQPTALINEAYLRLLDVQQVNWQDRAHFLAMAARLMRRTLVDHARAKNYQKRGGGAVRVTFDDMAVAAKERGHDLVALDDALELLAKVDERKSRVVEMRFFGGLTVEETASVLKVSVDTVMRDWKLAKVWLSRELKKAR